MLSRSFPTALFLALFALAITACGTEEEPEVDIIEAPSDVANPDLLGYWAVIEINDEIPAEDDNIRYQFTQEGEFVRYEGDTMTRSTFTFASPTQLTVNDVAGAIFYNYAIAGDELTLSEPGENGSSITLTRLADVDLGETRAPEPSTDIPEDSVPSGGASE